MGWEAIFMLLILKIPIVYLSVVIWWAIRAEKGPEEPALVPLEDTPVPWGGPRPGRGSRRVSGRPWHSGPPRGFDRAPRVAAARKDVRS